MPRGARETARIDLKPRDTVQGGRRTADRFLCSSKSLAMALI